MTFNDNSPIYRQIADRIKAEVLSGALRADEPVMSTNQYAEFYRINPATAAKAFQTLVDEGVLYKRRGIGMFVHPDAAAHLREDHRSRFFSDVVEPMIAEARTIGIPLAEIIAHLSELTANEATQHGQGALTEPITAESARRQRVARGNGNEAGGDMA